MTVRLLEHHTASLRRWRALVITITILLAFSSIILFLTVSLWLVTRLFVGACAVTLMIATALHGRLQGRQRFLAKQVQALHVTLTERQLELHTHRWSLALAYEDISYCDWCSRHKRFSGIPALCVVTPAFTVMLVGFARSEGLRAALQVLVPEQTHRQVKWARATLLASVGVLLAVAFWQRHHPWALLLPPLLLLFADVYALRLPQQVTGLERFRPQRYWYLRPRMALTLLTLTWSVWLLW